MFVFDIIYFLRHMCKRGGGGIEKPWQAVSVSLCVHVLVFELR